MAKKGWNDKEVGAVLALGELHQEEYGKPMAVQQNLAVHLGVYLGKLMGNQGRTACSVKNYLQGLPEKIKEGKITKKHFEISQELQVQQRQQLLTVLNQGGAAFGRRKGIKKGYTDEEDAVILACVTKAAADNPSLDLFVPRRQPQQQEQEAGTTTQTEVSQATAASHRYSNAALARRIIENHPVFQGRRSADAVIQRMQGLLKDDLIIDDDVWKLCDMYCESDPAIKEICQDLLGKTSKRRKKEGGKAGIVSLAVQGDADMNMDEQHAGMDVDSRHGQALVATGAMMGVYGAPPGNTVAQKTGNAAVCEDSPDFQPSRNLQPDNVHFDLKELLDKTERVYQQRAIDYAAGNPLEHLSAKLWRPYLTVAFLLSNGIKPIVGHASYKSIWGVLSFDFNNDSHREMMVRIEDVCNPWCGEQSPGHVVSDILHFQHYQEISTRQASRAGPVRCACCTKHDRQDVDAPKPIVAYVLVVKKMPWGARDTTTQTKGALHGKFDYATWLENRSTANSVRANAKWADALKADQLFILIHLPGHWVLVHVDMTHQVLEYIDSLLPEKTTIGQQGQFGADVLENIAVWISAVSQDMNLPHARKQLLKDCTSWNRVAVKCPRQPNLCDCGVYCCLAAMYISQGYELTYTADDITTVRKRIAVGLANNNLSTIWSPRA